MLTNWVLFLPSKFAHFKEIGNSIQRGTLLLWIPKGGGTTYKFQTGCLKQRRPAFLIFLFWKKSFLPKERGPDLQFLTLQTSHSIYFRRQSFFLSSNVITAAETRALIWFFMHQNNLLISIPSRASPCHGISFSTTLFFGQQNRATKVIIWHQNISPTFLPFSPPPSPGLRRAGLLGWGPGLL